MQTVTYIKASYSWFRATAYLMDHLHQWSLSWSLLGSFTSDNSFATSRILYLVLTEGENEKKNRNIQENRKRENTLAVVASDVDNCWNGMTHMKSCPKKLRRRHTFAPIFSSTTLNSARKHCRCQQRLQQRQKFWSPCR